MPALRLPLRLTATDPDAPGAPGSWNAPAAAATAAILVGLASQPRILVDAAAIELRYAERFAAGAGLTFNHGESILGFAHPLWTLLLAVLGLGGGSAELAARILGIAAFALTAALLVRVGRLIDGGGQSGLLAATLALLVTPFRDAMLSGSGGALTICLALAALEQSLRTRPIVAGVLFGLAAFNGIEALALPIGLAVAAWLQERRVPRRLLDFTATTWLVLLALLLVAFGSVIPAGGALLAGSAPQPIPAETSLGGALFGRFGYCLVFLAALRLLYLDRSRERERLGGLGLGIAFAAEALTRLVVQWGAAPSYELGSLFPPLILLASGMPGAIARSEEPYRKPRALAALVLLALAALPGLGTLAGRAASREAPNAREAFDLELRDAGRWLGGAARDDETVATSSAWAAFALPNDVTGVVPRSPADATEPPDYLVSWSFVVNEQAEPPTAPAGMVPLAIFDTARRERRDLPWITVFGAATSRIARSGARAYTLLDFDPPQPLAAPYGLQHVHFEGRDLFAHPPSGALFRVPNLRRAITLRFVPAFSPKVPPTGSDGVTFEVAEEGRLRYSSHLLPTDDPSQVLLRFPEARDRDETSITLVTRPGPAQNAVYDWVYWRDVRIEVEGKAPVPAAPAAPNAGDEAFQAPGS